MAGVEAARQMQADEKAEPLSRGRVAAMSSDQITDRWPQVEQWLAHGMPEPGGEE
jgi:hypothetical protein